MKIISPKKYSQEFQIGYHTVLKWCKNGTLTTLKTDGGSFKIIVDNIQSQLQEEEEKEKQKILT